MKFVTDVDELTPTHEAENGIWVKRDDLLCINGARGGKLRAGMALARGQSGVVGFGSRVATIGTYLSASADAVGTPCAYVTAHGPYTPEMDFAKGKNAEIIQVSPGYMSQCKSVAQKTAESRKWRFMPLSLESEEAIDATAAQVVGSIPEGVKRVVVTLGAGVTAAGIMKGLLALGRNIPMFGISIGKDPIALLNRRCPVGWRFRMKVVVTPEKYHEKCEELWCGIRLDPHYEAKCVRFLRPGDLFWIVGVRPETIDG